jgi:ABC-2 type transport system ATP-binding protein
MTPIMGMQMTQVIIRTEKLTKYYGKTLGIENLNFEIKRGELFGFLGPNGAGKSTTIRLLLNLLKPSAGRAFLFGKEVQKNYQHLFKQIGNVPGELKLYEELTGDQFLNYMNSFNGKKPLLRDELLHAFQLTDQDLEKKVKQYSRGMKQKLGIIQAMQEKPELLIMDEPSEGLDPLNKNVLYDYLLRLKNDGITIFFSSHNLAEVEKISDHVGLVKNGKFIALEPIVELKKKMVRRMEINFVDNVEPEEFSIPSLTLVSHREKHFVFNVQGEIDPILKGIAKYTIKDLVFPEPSLEDMFMTFYQKEKEK